MTHYEPVAVSERPCWIVGEAIATIVWSTNIIATAKIIAVRTRYLLRAAAAPLTRHDADTDDSAR